VIGFVFVVFDKLINVIHVIYSVVSGQYSYTIQDKDISLVCYCITDSSTLCRFSRSDLKIEVIGRSSVL